MEKKVPVGVLAMLGALTKKPGKKQKLVPRCIGWARTRGLIKDTGKNTPTGIYVVTVAGQRALKKGVYRESPSLRSL